MFTKSERTTSSPSTSSAAGSRARTSPWLETVPASREPGQVFGSSTSASFASYDPASCSWRTSQLSVLGDSPLYSGAWPRAGMMRSGIASQRSPLAPLTAVIASSSWRGKLLPTPSAQSYGSNQGGAAGREGQPTRYSLDSMAKHGLLPTPTVVDSKDGRNLTAGRTRENPKHHAGTTLSDVAWTLGAEGIGGQLHPRFCEWMMGFESEWTTVETDFVVSGTRSSRKSRNGSESASSRRKRRGEQHDQ